MTKEIHKNYRNAKAGQSINKKFSDNHPKTIVREMAKHAKITMPIISKKK